MLHSHNKRIIYESDDDSNDVQKVTKGETISSDVKRIICESDDESCDMRGNSHPVENILSGSSRSNLKRKSSDDCGRVTVDDGDAGRGQNLIENRQANLRQTRSALLSSRDDTPQSLRRSKRSAVAIVDNRNLHLTEATQAESVDSLQSLPMSTRMSAARSRRKRTAQNDEEEVDGVDDEETPDSESDSSTYDDDDDYSDESQEETGGTRGDRRSRSSRKSSKAEKHPRSYVTTRSQCDATASRMSSDRNQALSLAKEAKRDTLLKKMKRRLSAGESALDAISSSEEEEEGEEEEEVVKGKPPTGRRGIDSKKTVNDGTTRRQQSQPNTPGQHQRTSNGSQSSSRSSRPMSGSSAFIRKEVLPEKYNSDEDEMDDCVDDFIVGSDEERDEQQKQMEEIAREREKRHKRKEKERKRKAEEASIAIKKAEKERIKADKIELDKMRQQHSETKSRRRKVIVEDDDEDEGEGEEERKREGLPAATMASPFEGASPPQGTSSSSRKCYEQAGPRSQNRIEIVLSSDEEGTAKLIPNDAVEEESGDENSSTEDEGDEEEEEDDDEEDDEEWLDGPMLYRRVDAMREELEERDVHSTSIMKVYSHPEALMLYVEMLAHAHADPSFVTHCADVSLRRAGATRSHASSSSSSSSGASTASTMRIREYLAAARQIENLICTSRESLLGSSAWRPDFLAALKSRPFYFVTELPSSCYDERCQACNRTSHSVNRKVHLFGPHYDADRAWMKSEWDKELPSALFLHADAEVARRKKGRGKNIDIHLHLSGSSSDDDAKVKGKGKSQSDNRDRGRRQDRQVIDLLEEEEDDEEEEEEEEEEVFIAWWQRKWRRQLVTEAESGWHLASHCRARTQMYHTLLHYKARLFLKIGDKLRMCGSVSALIADSAYMCQEVDRFHALLKTAGDKWGGGKEMSEQAADLWLDSSAADSTESSHKAKSRPGEGRTTVLDFIVGRERQTEGIIRL